MKKQTTIKSIAACALFCWSAAAFAHSGHSLPEFHWHATDTLGFVVVAGLAAEAIWLSRK